MAGAISGVGACIVHLPLARSDSALILIMAIIAVASRTTGLVARFVAVTAPPLAAGGIAVRRVAFVTVVVANRTVVVGAATG